MIAYGHWTEGARLEAQALGLTGRWVDVNRIGDPVYAAEVFAARDADPDWRFILFIDLTESRVQNEYGAWDVLVGTCRWLRDTGLYQRCAAIQFADEFWSRLSGFGASAAWPSMSGWSPERCWSERWELARLIGHRAADLRAFWQNEIGTACPMIGTAESGGVTPPEFTGQEWWGLNIYQRGREARHRAAVQAIYAQAWAFTRLPLMPVLPTYVAADTRPVDQIPTVVDLGLTYAQGFRHDGRDYPAIIDHPQTWAVGVFCVRWPGEDNVAHGEGLGLTRLDSSYSDGVRWLSAHLRGR